MKIVKYVPFGRLDNFDQPFVSQTSTNLELAPRGRALEYGLPLTAFEKRPEPLGVMCLCMFVYAPHKVVTLKCYVNKHLSTDAFQGCGRR